MLNPTQFKLLSRIDKVDKYNCRNCSESAKSVLGWLYINGLIKYHYSDPDNLHTFLYTCEITQKGKVVLYEYRKDNRRWRIPVIISIIATAISLLAIIVSLYTNIHLAQ